MGVHVWLGKKASRNEKNKALKDAQVSGFRPVSYKKDYVNQCFQ